MNKSVRVMLPLLLLILCLQLSACGGPVRRPEGKKTLVVTACPVYDWLTELLRGSEEFELIWLLENGADMHSYQPSTGDIVGIADCDLFVYVGGESDVWVSKVLTATEGGSRRTLDLMQYLGDRVRPEETIEGMEAEEEENGEERGDEHIWLSLKNAIRICRGLEQALAELDPDNRELYRHNREAYEEKLCALDREFEAFARDARAKGRNTVLVADRFPFLYLLKDYELQYYAAFPGCSSESDASFETIIFLAEKLNALELPVILELEHSDSSIAEAVKTAAKSEAQICPMDSLQSCSLRELRDGRNYLNTMEYNLAALRAALEG